MIKYLKWLAIFVGFIMAIVPIVVFSPLVLILSTIGLWYFTKKKPNVQFRNYARNALIVSAVGSGLFIAGLNSEEDEMVHVEDAINLVENFDAEAEAQVKLKEQEETEQNEKKEEERKRKQRAKRRAEKIAEERKIEKELSEANPNKTGVTVAPNTIIDVEEGKLDIDVNDNIPFFSNEDITSLDTYHRNGPLDSLGRVTAANALLGVEIMPAEQRGSIGHHEPTGWSQARYANIDSGGWLYNRSHLLGYQLTGNDDFSNLMTGTRQFNMAMLEYENFVANYIETTENHVRYRVTPVFEGNNLVASGAYMEGFSIEDNGEGLMFNIYIPNVQDGVTIDYVNGSSVGPEGPSQDGEIAQYTPPKKESSTVVVPAPAPKPKAEPKPEPSPPPAPVSSPGEYVDENGNGLIKGSNQDIYHVPGSTYYTRTKNVKQWFKTTAEAEAAGFRAPKK